LLNNQSIKLLRKAINRAKLGVKWGEEVDNMSNNSIPVSTRWLLDSVGETERLAVKAVYMLVCPKTQQKGTAFSLKTGLIISNWHVVEGCTAADIIGISSEGHQIHFNRLISDQNRDLVALMPQNNLTGGLGIVEEGDIQVGTQVTTWGYPLGYNGPAPLLTIGFLSGFSDSPPYEETASVVKHLVVNGAFNPGNSGGPLFIAGSQDVIGVVISKHAPISSFVRSAIEALEKNPSGFMYSSTDEQGNKHALSEAQVVAEVLKYFRMMTQVVIGEAIAGSELIAFLETNKLPWQA
jgi:S1-C subfamily serine protease